MFCLLEEYWPPLNVCGPHNSPLQCRWESWRWYSSISLTWLSCCLWIRFSLECRRISNEEVHMNFNVCPVSRSLHKCLGSTVNNGSLLMMKVWVFYRMWDVHGFLQGSVVGRKMAKNILKCFPIECDRNSKCAPMNLMEMRWCEVGYEA